MSSKILRYLTLYDSLKESIDFEKAESLPLEVGRDVKAMIEGREVHVRVEAILPRHLPKFFKREWILYKEYEGFGYYNIGFDVEGSTVQTEKADYKTLASILAIVVKSSAEWLEKEKPEVVTIFADGKTEKERRKKQVIYLSIIQGNPQLIDGYIWEKVKTPEGNSMIVLMKRR